MFWELFLRRGSNSANEKEVPPSVREALLSFLLKHLGSREAKKGPGAKVHTKTSVLHNALCKGKTFVAGVALTTMV